MKEIQTLKVRKRTGRIVDFDGNKIRQSVASCLMANDKSNRELSEIVGEAYSVGELAAKEIEDEYHFAGSDSLHVDTINTDVIEWLKENYEEGIVSSYAAYAERHMKVRMNNMDENELLENRVRKVISTAYAVVRGGRSQELLELEDDINIVSLTLRELNNNAYRYEILNALILVGKQLIEKNPILVSRMVAIFLEYKVCCDMGIKTYGYSPYNLENFLGNTGVNANYVLHPPTLTAILHMLNEKRPKLDYLGMQTLYDRYLMRDSDDNIVETPAMMFMRVALGVCECFFDQKHPMKPTMKELIGDHVKPFYESMVDFKYMPSTPTLFNAGNITPQLSSCFLTYVPDDLHEIYTSFRDNAMLSKFAGGLGNAWSAVRGLDARIQGTNGKSSGIIPFLKVANDTAIAVNQGGKRRGAVCAYLEPWHIDMYDFLDLRKNTGDDRRRTHDMHTALWIPDLFMQYVKDDRDWYLFSPDETPLLAETYGDDFEYKYRGYIDDYKNGQIKVCRVVKARKLWITILQRIYETGHPWICFKDRANQMNPQKHEGVIHSSNLCTEIVLNTSKDEIAVCNLGSVNLAQHVMVTENGETIMNWPALHDTVHTAVTMLNCVIDSNYYAVDKAERSNKKHRPIGLGIMGLADVLFMMHLPFDSHEAVKLSDDIMRHVACTAIHASANLAQKYGKYESYSDSQWDQGYFPIDNAYCSTFYDRVAVEYNLDNPKLFEEKDDNPYRALRYANDHYLHKIVEDHGLRNCNLLAIAPTATISNICGVYPSIEPQYSNYYAKTNLSGNFINMNPYLWNELNNYDLWNEDMLQKIKANNGSIQNIDEIPDFMKEVYKTAFEVDQKALVDAAAVRQRWVDQSQSVNLFVSSQRGRDLWDLYFHCWENGLKTTYYLRTLAETDVEKSSGINVGEQNRVAAPSQTAQTCSIDDRVDCEACE